MDNPYKNTRELIKLKMLSSTTKHLPKTMRRSHAKKGLSELQLHSSKDRTLSLIPGYCSTLKKGQVVALHPSGPKMLEAESMRGAERS